MTLYTKSDPKTIQRMFGSIAPHYDRANAILSFQMHKYWNRALVNQVVAPYSPDSLLDLCCGTGEIAYTYLKRATHPCEAHLLDFCEEMLLCAKKKREQLQINPIHTLHYVQADAQAIPLLAKSVACATIAYGIRNVKDPLICMQEVWRVLRPGGTFGILELTEPENLALKMGHRLYLRTVLPILGRYISSNQAAYQYLCDSIQAFIQPQVVEQLLQQAGFIEVKRIPLNGGIATILFAKKPF